MPDKTVYKLTAQGKTELGNTLSHSIVTFDYDANIFSIAAFFLDYFDVSEQKKLLEMRLDNLYKYLQGIEKQVTTSWEEQFAPFHVANVKRMIEVVNAEINGTKQLLESISEVHLVNYKRQNLD